MLELSHNFSQILKWKNLNFLDFLAFKKILIKLKVQLTFSKPDEVQ